GGDVTGPTFSTTYSIPANATAAGAQTVTAYNGANSTTTSQFTLTPDSLAPAAGTVSYTTGVTSSASITLTPNDGVDAGAGSNPASRIYQKETATLTNGTSASFAALAT